MTERTEALLAELVDLHRKQLANQERAIAQQQHSVALQEEAVRRQKTALRRVWLLVGALAAVIVVPYMIYLVMWVAAL